MNKKVFQCIFYAISVLLLIQTYTYASGLEDRINTVEQALISQNKISDYIWTMTAAALVLLMQLGFLFLEAGLSRSKNSIGVAQKNLTDMLICVCVFYLIGFTLMFNTSVGGWIGFPTLSSADDRVFTFFVFQTVIVATAATIVSGAVAERMKFTSYLLTTLCIAAIIYPTFGHWAWGNRLFEDNPAWLADLGFIDIAGATVVHSVGGWVGLAAIIVLGPRIGKFNQDGSPNHIDGHSMVLSVAGSIILFAGWFGFTGGFTKAGTSEFTLTIENTLLAGTFGGVSALILGYFMDKLFRPTRPINGMIGGLVAISACSHMVSPNSALIIGLISGVVVILSEEFLVRICKLDDVVGAVSVHGIGGTLGTLLLAFFIIEDQLLAETRLDQFLIQLLGVTVAFIWTFGIAFLLFKILNIISPIRVSKENELAGLNLSEHGTALGTSELRQQLQDITRGETFNLTKRLDENSGDEAAEIAQVLNPFIAQLHSLIGTIKTEAHSVEQKSKHLSTLAQSVDDTANNITNTSSKTSASASIIEDTLEGSSKIIKEINNEGQEISTLAQGMSEEVTTISDAVKDLLETIHEISGHAEDTNKVSKQAMEFAENSKTTVASLHKAVREIDDVVSFILEISHKTNLLALNATIEASRSGIHGRGFNVVAEEVKALSQKTAGAVEEICEKVQKVKNGSTHMENGIEELTGIIEKITDAVNKIGNYTDAQGNATFIVETSVDQVRENSNLVTQRINALSDQLVNASNSSQMIADLSNDFSNAANNLKSEAEESQQSSHIVRWTSDALDSTSEKLNTATNKFIT